MTTDPPTPIGVAKSGHIKKSTVDVLNVEEKKKLPEDPPKQRTPKGDKRILAQAKAGGVVNVDESRVKKRTTAAAEGYDTVICYVAAILSLRYYNVIPVSWCRSRARRSVR